MTGTRGSGAGTLLERGETGRRRGAQLPSVVTWAACGRLPASGGRLSPLRPRRARCLLLFSPASAAAGGGRRRAAAAGCAARSPPPAGRGGAGGPRRGGQRREAASSLPPTPARCPEVRPPFPPARRPLAPLSPSPLSGRRRPTASGGRYSAEGASSQASTSCGGGAAVSGRPVKTPLAPSSGPGGVAAGAAVGAAVGREPQRGGSGAGGAELRFWREGGRVGVF